MDVSKNDPNDVSRKIGTIITLVGSVIFLIFFEFPKPPFDDSPFWSKFIKMQPFEKYPHLIDTDSSLIYFILLFIVIHLIRMSFGLYFLTYDESFGRVKSISSNKKVKLDIVIRTFFILSFLILSFQLGYDSYLSIVINLLLQGFVLVLYNKLYWKEMYKQDADKKANYFILVGDFTYLLASFLLIVVDVKGLNHFLAHFLVFLIGGYFVVFMGETITQYFKTFIIAISDVFNFFFKHEAENTSNSMINK